jgi:hypothetical protein
MPTSAKYHRFSVRCLQEARRSDDEPLKALLIEMAQAWRMLADQAAVNERLQARPAGDETDPGD